MENFLFLFAILGIKKIKIGIVNIGSITGAYGPEVKKVINLRAL